MRLGKVHAKSVVNKIGWKNKVKMESNIIGTKDNCLLENKGVF